MADHTPWTDLRPRRVEREPGYRDEMLVSEFRELVHRLRTDAGLTQAELAERMGTTQSAVARLEGGAPPSLRTLEKLAGAVGGELSITIAPAGDGGGYTMTGGSDRDPGVP